MNYCQWIQSVSLHLKKVSTFEHVLYILFLLFAVVLFAQFLTYIGVSFLDSARRTYSVI